MLDQYKKVYEHCASAIPNWGKINKNDLINQYIDHENDPKMAKAYLSAIILRYWNTLYKFHLLSYKSTSDITLYHDWLVDGITRGIAERKWKDPNNKLYTDPNGPDKVMNRCMISERLVWFQGSNTYKRRQNFFLESLDKLKEELEDNFFPSIEDSCTQEEKMDLEDLVSKSFDNKEYLMAFMIDCIVNYDVFDRTKDDEGKHFIQFNENKLLKHLNNLNSNEIKIFSKLYNKPLSEVEKSVISLQSLSREKVKKKVRLDMKKLKRIYLKYLEV